MSGICGILRFDGGPVAARDLERLANALAHRGPDGVNFGVNGAVGLGHCLMRVTREDQYEAQPLHDREADLVVVADLRLDNRNALAPAFNIGAAVLSEVTDSALVVRAYSKWGEACAEHLLGDFAFAIWDGRSKKLVLGRDHMGQRSVVYYRNEQFFMFASETKALHTHPEAPRVVTDAQIGRLLMHDRTPREGGNLFEGINSLPAATVMIVGANGSLATRRYWQPQADPAHQGRDEAYYIEAYRRVLGDAVACRLRRVTRPPGLVFSGGYDSAAIAGLAGPALAESRPQAHRRRIGDAGRLSRQHQTRATLGRNVRARYAASRRPLRHPRGQERAVRFGPGVRTDRSACRALSLRHA
jgi:asparagine synthase (glutamine-hydrolysing)